MEVETTAVTVVEKQPEKSPVPVEEVKDESEVKNGTNDATNPDEKIDTEEIKCDTENIELREEVTNQVEDIPQALITIDSCNTDTDVGEKPVVTVQENEKIEAEVLPDTDNQEATEMVELSVVRSPRISMSTEMPTDVVEDDIETVQEFTEADLISIAIECDGEPAPKGIELSNGEVRPEDSEDIYGDLDEEPVVEMNTHSQDVIDNLASEQMEVDGGTGEKPISRASSSGDFKLNISRSDDDYDDPDEAMDDEDVEEEEEDVKPNIVRKPISDPIEIVSLDDSDDDDDRRAQSDEKSEEDDDYEETDDDSDEVVSSDADIEPTPGSSKMVFNPLAALLKTKPTVHPKFYTKSQLDRIFLQRMGRRSRKWLSWRRNRLEQTKSTMQIMDDSDIVECETKIPNHASPKIVKAEDLKEVKKTQTPVEKEENSTKNEENKENDKDLNENKLEEVVEEEEKLNDSVQVLDESEEIEEMVISQVDDDEEKPAEEESKIEDIGSDHESDKPKPMNGEVKEDEEEEAVNLCSDSAAKKTPSPVDVEISCDPLKEDKPALSEEQARIIEELKELSSPKSVKLEPQTTVERSTKRPLETETVEEDLNPTKRLRTELENSFGRHDKILREYIEHTSSKSDLKELQQHIAVVDNEIFALDRMLLAKEEEWNNILHLKKVKEEIRLRLQRKRNVLELNTNAIDEIPSGPTEKVTSTPIASHNNSSNQMIFNNSSLLQSTLKSFRDAKKKENNNVMPPFSQSLTHNNVTVVPLSHSSSASSTGSTAAQAILQSRVNMKPTDKEKSVAQKVQRNILPRPTLLPNHEQILRNLAMSSASTSSEAAAAANAFNELMLNVNGHAMNVNMGRQGPIKAVSSIIADFREKHPEQIPRRGRRMKGAHESNSRPSSADSSHSNPPTPAPNLTANNFKDILAQFAKMSPQERQLLSSSNSIISALNMSTQFQHAQLAAAAAAVSQQQQHQQQQQQQQKHPNKDTSSNKPPPYPEVTLHPVVSAQAAAAAQVELSQNSGSNSLLHGILTKTNNRPAAATNATTNNAFTSGYSPTLARLLTSPERISSHQQNYQPTGNSPLSTLAAGLNLSNKNSEITITPVVNSQSLQQTLLAQQQRQKDFLNLEDDNDDNSQDRLVIDEGDNQQNSYGGQDVDADVPRCQGCKKHESRFVCAGCGNQWYCSRECQVAAWDEHSEVCTG